jgi:hypothetical protein
MIRTLPVHPRKAGLIAFVRQVRRRLGRIEAAMIEGVPPLDRVLIADELEAAAAHLEEADFLVARQILRLIAQPTANDNGRPSGRAS